MNHARPIGWITKLRQSATVRVALALALSANLAPDAIAAVLLPGSGADAAPEQSQWAVEQVMNHLAKKNYDAAVQAAIKLVQSYPDNPVGYNLLGVAQLGKRDVAGARTAFEKAIGLKSDFSPALMNLAQVELDKGDLDSARSRYLTVLASEPKNIFAMIGLARIDFSRRKNDDGIQWLERAKGVSPDALAPRLLLASQLLRTQNSLKALAEMIDAYRSHPNNPDVLDLLGQAQLATGRMSDAATTYKKLTTLRPESPLGHYRLAVAQISLGALAAARDSLNKALQLKPGGIETLHTLAALELQAGRYDEALKTARQLQGLQPKAPTGWVLEGDILGARKLPAQALPAYEKAVTLGGQGAVIIKVHATELAAGVPKAQADARLQTWLQAHPDDARVRRYQASEYMRAGLTKEAIEQFQRVVQDNPKDGISLNNLANLYHRQKDPRAIELAEKAYIVMPDSAAAADTLGWILVERGSTARGLEMLRKAAAREPANAEVAYHLAYALAKSGDKAKARGQLEKLLASEPDFPQREAAKALLERL